MLQRINLARALAAEPRVLLLDEPFSALDDQTRDSTRALVKDLTRKHKWATVLVTHSSYDIAAVAERLYRLENGTLVEDVL